MATKTAYRMGRGEKLFLWGFGVLGVIVFAVAVPAIVNQRDRARTNQVDADADNGERFANFVVDSIASMDGRSTILDAKVLYHNKYHAFVQVQTRHKYILALVSADDNGKPQDWNIEFSGAEPFPYDHPMLVGKWDDIQKEDASRGTHTTPVPAAAAAIPPIPAPASSPTSPSQSDQSSQTPAAVAPMPNSAAGGSSAAGPQNGKVVSQTSPGPSISAPNSNAASPLSSPAVPTPALPSAQTAGDQPSKVLVEAPAVFPQQARQMNWETNRDHAVSLMVFVSEQGQPLKVNVVEGVPGGYGFDEVAVEAAKKSTFAPATKNGVPTRGWLNMKVMISKINP